jgi:hypothetical protein
MKLHPSQSNDLIQYLGNKIPMLLSVLPLASDFFVLTNHRDFAHHDTADDAVHRSIPFLLICFALHHILLFDQLINLLTAFSLRRILPR